MVDECCFVYICSKFGVRKGSVLCFITVIWGLSIILGIAAIDISLDESYGVPFFTENFSLGGFLAAIFFITLAVNFFLGYFGVILELPRLLTAYSVLMAVLLLFHVSIIIMMFLKLQDEHYFNQTIPGIIEGLLTDDSYALASGFGCTSSCDSVVPATIEYYLVYTVTWTIILVVLEVLSIVVFFLIRKKVFVKNSWWIFPVKPVENESPSDDNGI